MSLLFLFFYDSQVISIGKTELLNHYIAVDISFNGYDPFEKIWITVRGFKDILHNFSTEFLLILQQEPLNNFFAILFHAIKSSQNFKKNNLWNFQIFF